LVKLVQRALSVPFLQQSSNSVVMALDFHPCSSTNPGSSLAVTYMSHCWHQEGHSTKIASVHQKVPLHTFHNS